MGITEAQLRDFVMQVNVWASSLYFPAFARELGVDPEAEPGDVDAAHAESDRLGVAWRQLLEELLDGEDVDAVEVAADIHAWGAAKAESARRSAVSFANPGRPLLGEFQLDAETDSQAARLRWVEPLVALLDRSAPAPS